MQGERFGKFTCLSCSIFSRAKVRRGSSSTFPGLVFVRRTMCGVVPVLLVTACKLCAATHYVSQANAKPEMPYTNWSTAATSIQMAVDAAEAGDEIVVSQGVYAGGLNVDRPVKLRSVGGPASTMIDGGRMAQCVALADGASLCGFTLANGVGLFGGGVSCTSTNALLTNCVFTGNAAVYGMFGDGGCGGGAFGGTLYRCTLSNNSAGDGGGAYAASLYGCSLTGNSATEGGGGASGATLYNCRLSDNSAWRGGGASESTLYSCALSGNSAVGWWEWRGQPVYQPGCGGAVEASTLYNCTLTGNWATDSGGGAAGCTLYNCIAHFNVGDNEANYDRFSSLNYCCTTPLPPNGVGNLALEPELASASHLSESSPCRGAGSAAFAVGEDIDGELWSNPPSIGCDEYHPGLATGPLTVDWQADHRAVTPGYPVRFTALVTGMTKASAWDFGDGSTATNLPYVTHSWTEPGVYRVVLQAYNESRPEGVSMTGMVRVARQHVLYVDATSADPQPPYVSWSNAARGIQEAVDAVAGIERGDAVVVVTNGVYSGSVRVTDPVILRSVNGPGFTVIDGGGSARCVSLTEGASLSGFTFTNGRSGVWCASTDAWLTNCVIVGNGSGGANGCTLVSCTVSSNSGTWGSGAFKSTLYDCTLSGNSATGNGGGASGSILYRCTLVGNSARGGGGAENCALFNCLVTANSAVTDGGGAYGCSLYNCTVTGNSADSLHGTGGGVFASVLYNSIVYLNTAASGPNFDSHGLSTLDYCCTTPLPGKGTGSVTNAPGFIDYSHGDLRLQSNSSCVNAGNNAFVATVTDVDGNPRIVGGTVDLGASECQMPAWLSCFAWLQTYQLATDAAALHADADGDGLNNWQEWICGTCPTNPFSTLRLLSATPMGTAVSVTWQSVAGTTYVLERSTSPAEAFKRVAANIIGQADTTTYIDTNGTGTGPLFYRVAVTVP